MFCKNRKQNVDLPLKIHVNGCLNRSTPLKVKILIHLRNRFIYTRTGRTYCHLYVASRKVLNNSSVIIDTHTPSPLLRLIHLNVCTVTGDPPLKKCH